ncbi:hypothetical protein F2Q69_00057920 [Brassica cretica]|uniref:Uncharacterized protein n=1 Tax=Brassica cretica TaxID=69181 RepID=A0A8S9MWX7_BRACR|nr:hypothetical protein F2Q69_00057920 [Brassica cretica]
MVQMIVRKSNYQDLKGAQDSRSIDSRDDLCCRIGSDKQAIYKHGTSEKWKVVTLRRDFCFCGVLGGDRSELNRFVLLEADVSTPFKCGIKLHGA